MPGHPGTPPTLPSSFSGSSPTFLGTRVVRLRGTLPGRLYPGYPRGKPVLKKNPHSFCNREFPYGSRSRARAPGLCSDARLRRAARGQYTPGRGGCWEL